MIGNDNSANQSLHDLVSERFAIANLYGKLLNQYADISSEELDDVSVFKALTGGDNLDAEFKGKNHFTFRNHAKLLFSCNTMPVSMDMSDAFFRRWVIIDFPHSFDGIKANKFLINELMEEQELSGIFNEAMLGLKTIITNQRFSNEQETAEIRERYIRMSDSVAAYLMDEVEVTTTGFIAKSELYDTYLIYCAHHKYLAVSEQKFFRRLIARVTVDEYKPTVAGKRMYAWKGIKFKNRGNYVEDDNRGVTSSNNEIKEQDKLKWQDNV